MAISDEQKREYVKRLLVSRTRLLCDHGFYGVLLMHMRFALDEGIKTAGTDGTTTYFNPAFLDSLSDRELDFVFMHEVLHVVLQHCSRYEERHRLLFNVACDIVVNSNVLYSNGMDVRYITLKEHGEAMHLTPAGEEGYLYTAEEVYEMLMREAAYMDFDSWDDHGFWGAYAQNSAESDAWRQHFKDACLNVQRRGYGDMPAFAERLLKDMQKSRINWREQINDFVQQDVCDYSFSPPDKRFFDSDFMIPDYNDYDTAVKNVLFFIDTSASMSDKMVTEAYAEVKGAIDQYGGKLQGKLGFFDGNVKQPLPFGDVEDLMKIKPIGGGGTSFINVFKYVTEHMQEDPPVAIILITDGYAPFPEESAANGIPVLWVLNNTRAKPPWGKVLHIKEV